MSSILTDSSATGKSHGLSAETTPHQINLGDRVQVHSAQGTIRFIGSTDFKAGTWVGIELDTVGTGKNDGSVNGIRYFSCPPRTGLFMLATALLKQQPKRLLSHQTIKKQHAPDLVSTSQLLKKIEALEAENKQLRQQNEDYVSQMTLRDQKIGCLEKSVADIKNASLESIELLEKLVQTKYQEAEQLEYALQTEMKKSRASEDEKETLHKTILGAIESYETSLGLIEKNQKEQKEKLEKHHHQELRVLMQDVVVLESFLQTKLNRETELISTMKRSQQQILRLQAELKKNSYQIKMNSSIDYRYSAPRERMLNTPIEEEDEEEDSEDDLTFEDPEEFMALHGCALCGKKGHHLIHCDLLNIQNQSISLSLCS